MGVTNLSVLERVLESETVYLELVQEETSGESVLAVFESSVRDLLFPRPAERLSYSGVDLDLLMEPTRDFPVRRRGVAGGFSPGGGGEVGGWVGGILG